MGYTTDFYGEFELDKPLSSKHRAYLTAFSDTRRMMRNKSKLPERITRIHSDSQLKNEVEGEYFVDGGGMCGQDADSSVIDYNYPPSTQPGLWCQWVPNEEGTAILWNESEKFYNYTEWLEYIIDNFLAPFGYVLSGEVKWEGEEHSDIGLIIVKDNRVTTKAGHIVYK